jgi:mitochondrial fission process protein 1
MLVVAHPAPESGVSFDQSYDGSPAFDPLRDGPLRYCGYANEMGEAFAAWLPPLGVPASYAIAILYVLVDTYDKASAAHRQAQGLHSSTHSTHAADPEAARRIITLLTSERAVDTLIWQMLASVIIPGFVIHEVVYYIHLALLVVMHLDNLQQAPPALVGVISTAATASSLPADEVWC